MDDQNLPSAPAATPVAPNLPADLSVTPVLSTPQPILSANQVIQIGNYKIKVDRALCIGAASCIAVSPTTFELDSENKAIIKAGSADTPENILMAAQSCPTKAIIITDAATGEQVWPK